MLTVDFPARWPIRVCPRSMRWAVASWPPRRSSEPTNGSSPSSLNRLTRTYGRLLAAEIANARILEEAAGDDDPVDAAGLEALQMRSLTVRQAVGVAEEDVEAAWGSDVLDAAEQGGEEGVGDVGDDHGEHVRLAQLQPASDPVGLVAGLAQQRLDARPGAGGDPQARIVVRHPRDGGRVDVGAGRQLLERHRHMGLALDIGLNGALG